MKINVVGPKAEIDKLREKLEPRLVRTSFYVAGLHSHIASVSCDKKSYKRR